MLLMFDFFFFQAEDGIRDAHCCLEFRRVLFRSALACLWSAAAPAAEPVRVGVLKYGTVNWEISIIQRHDMDVQHGFHLEVLELASDQATAVALQAGEVDIIVSDWLWVSRQRAEGKRYTFVPFPSSVGSLMVPPDSPIRDLARPDTRRVGKGWVGT